MFFTSMSSRPQPPPSSQQHPCKVQCWSSEHNSKLYDAFSLFLSLCVNYCLRNNHQITYNVLRRHGTDLNPCHLTHERKKAEQVALICLDVKAMQYYLKATKWLKHPHKSIYQSTLCDTRNLPKSIRMPLKSGKNRSAYSCFFMFLVLGLFKGCPRWHTAKKVAFSESLARSVQAITCINN